MEYCGKKKEKNSLSANKERGDFHALSIWRKGSGAFLVQVRTLDGAGPLLWVQV